MASTVPPSSTVRFSCSGCGAELKAPAAYAGKVAKCKSCGSRVQIPALEEEYITSDLLGELDATTPAPPPQKPIAQGEAETTASESGFLKWVIGGAVLLVILVGGAFIISHVISSSKQAQLFSELESSVKGLLSTSADCRGKYDYNTASEAVEKARQHVNESKASRAHVLLDVIDAEAKRVKEEERDHKAKLSQGYVIFEGQFIPAQKRDGILAERKRAEAEARLAVERQKAEEERQAREEAERQRQAEAAAAAEARKAALTKSEAAKSALDAMRKIQSATSSGITYVQYGPLITNARAALDVLKQDEPALYEMSWCKALELAFNDYGAAGELWSYNFATEFSEEMKGVAVFTTYADHLYPELKKPVANGGAMYYTDAGTIHKYDRAATIVWSYASKDMALAEKFWAQGE